VNQAEEVRGQGRAQKPRAYKTLQKQDGTACSKFPIYEDSRVYSQDSIYIIEDNLVETAGDDDLQTDRFVLDQAHSQCMEDINGLLLFIKKNKNFRAKTNIAKRYKGKDVYKDDKENQSLK